MTVISEHTEETLSQKEWEEKLLVVREGRRDCGVAWLGGESLRAVPFLGSDTCLDLVAWLGEGQAGVSGVRIVCPHRLPTLL